MKDRFVMVRIVKASNAPTETLGGTQRTHLLSSNDGAKRFGVLFITVKPEEPPHVKYHFHKKRESAFFVIQGRARIIVENEEHFVEPNTLVFIPPGEKHQLMNAGNTELRVVEVYSPLPFEGDNYIVKKPK